MRSDSNPTVDVAFQRTLEIVRAQRNEQADLVAQLRVVEITLKDLLKQQQQHWNIVWDEQSDQIRRLNAELVAQKQIIDALVHTLDEAGVTLPPEVALP